MVGNSTSEKELKVTGIINGTDIKFIRQLVSSGKVSILDWSEVSIVAGGKILTLAIHHYAQETALVLLLIAIEHHQGKEVVCR